MQEIQESTILYIAACILKLEILKRFFKCHFKKRRVFLFSKNVRNVFSNYVAQLLHNKMLMRAANVVQTVVQ